jgi:hypothetical protein
LVSLKHTRYIHVVNFSDDYTGTVIIHITKSCPQESELDYSYCLTVKQMERNCNKTYSDLYEPVTIMLDKHKKSNV